MRYEEFVALDSKMTPLLGTIPLLVPGDLYFSILFPGKTDFRRIVWERAK
jgi:hypothetical protein